MAINKPPGDNVRKGAVRKRSQLKTKIEGEEHWAKRDKTSGEFMARKKDPEAPPYKGLRKPGRVRDRASSVRRFTAWIRLRFPPVDR